MTLIIVLLYLSLTVFFIPRFIARKVSKSWRARALVSVLVAFALTMGPFLSDGYHIYKTQAACAKQRPYIVHRPFEEWEFSKLKMDRVNEGSYTKVIITAFDKRTAEPIYTIYIFNANTTGPFHELLEGNLKLFHPFSPAQHCPYEPLLHQEQLFNELKGN